MQKITNKKIHQILVYSAWTVSIIGILTLLGFANYTLDEKPCKAIEVNIDHVDEHEFIRQENISISL